MCGRYHIPNNPLWPARYRTALFAARGPISLRATDLRWLDTITGPPLQNFDRGLNLSGTTSVDHSHVPPPPSSPPPPSLRKSRVLLLLLLRGSWTRSPCSRGGAPCLWARVPNLPKYGACAAEAPVARRRNATCLACVPGRIPKAAGEVALAAADRSYSRSGLLLGHNNQGPAISPLFRVGLSKQPGGFAGPRGLCEDRQFIKYPIGRVLDVLTGPPPPLPEPHYCVGTLLLRC